ncbi:MAG: dynamin family protein [Gammaproteobacteria bacterium]|nr:dynamin family protein [Gammaproteobacteria bacterium]
MSEIKVQDEAGASGQPSGKPVAPAAASLARDLERFRSWRESFKKAIADYQDWVEKHEPVDGVRDLRIYQLIESLDKDELKIAFVGEFSRGKTELLNAIFFSDRGQRLMPSSAGRTTMCPTELRYKANEDPGIKLLPIETRKTGISIAEYLQSPIHWTTLRFSREKTGFNEDDIETFKSITRTKKVHISEARALGLYRDAGGQAVAEQEGGMVDIPMWRYAIVNYRHPYLEQGVVVIDTPGLNALGAEPELTLSVLPDAHAVIFLLAADTGVTASDMTIWSDHVVSAKKDRLRERLVVLNKVDVLWDALRSDAEISHTIRNQVMDTARILKLRKDVVLPVSAKMGLIGKIKSDNDLVGRSGIARLEKQLAFQIIPAKHELIKRKITYEISSRVESSQALVRANLAELDRQLTQLRALGSKNKSDIQKLIDTMRKDKERYDREVKIFDITRRQLADKAGALFSNMDLDELDKHIKGARKSMHDSWTTRGLKSEIKDFFEAVARPMDQLKTQADAIKSEIDKICERLHYQYDLEKIVPPRLALLPYIMAIKSLEQKAEVFRNSVELVITEQGGVISKFFITLVSEVRNIYKECNGYTQSWFNNVINQIHNQVKLHKKSLDVGFETIKKSHADMDKIADHVARLEAERAGVSEQLQNINRLHARLHKSV